MKFKYILIPTIGTFLVCFLAHFIYDMFPNTMFSIFFPVNESIWEHMKIIFSSILLYGIIDKLIIIKSNKKTNNYLFALTVSALLSIPIYLIMFLPIYYNVGHNMIITLIILLITILISIYIKEFLLKFNNNKYLFILSIILITISYITFGYLTYKPIKNHLFYDTKNEQYGLTIYNI